MKKVLLFTAALLLSGGLFIQGQSLFDLVGPEQGDYFTGGGVNFSLNSSGIRDADDPSQSGLSAGFDAYLGRFATDQLAYGVILGYQYTGNTFNPNTDLEYQVNENTFSAGAFGRVYSNPCSETVNGYLQGEVGFGTGSIKDDFSGTEVIDDLGSFWAGVRPGIVVYPTDNIMLELQYGFLGYQSTSTTTENPMNGEETTSYNRWGGFDFDAKTLSICLMYRLPYPSWNEKMNGSFDGFGSF